MSGGRILVTGVAGFIGFHIARRLLGDGFYVVGIDDLNDYYDVSLKTARLAELSRKGKFECEKIDIVDRLAVEHLFSEKSGFESVLHLAAQPGVRYSIRHPERYVDTNLVGFGNVLEGCRHAEVGHLIFASSSSVYGAKARAPFSEDDAVDHSVNLYAATKKANEVMAHSYASLFGLPCTGLRFFTVYGPWGRPDMAYFSFTRCIDQGLPIDVYNHGEMQRDFTYIDDVSDALMSLLQRPPTGDPNWSENDSTPSTSYAPYRILNIGNNRPEKLGRLIECIEDNLGKKAEKRMLEMQPGEIKATCADIARARNIIGFDPSTSLEAGIRRFIDWYRQYS
jgi:UDP-glucuronate 4-epimerase